MPRPLRIQSAGFVHHVISKGNDGQSLFRSSQDYDYYISLVELAKKKFPIQIYNYVLMTNHVHLLVEPKEDGSLSRFMEYVSKQYAKYFNKTYGRSGHLFQGRYKSFLVQTDRYFFICSRYIDLNPVKAHIAADPKKFPYSGYSYLAEGKKSSLKLDKHDLYLNLGSTDLERRIAYRTLVLNYQGEEIDLINRRAGILGDREFKEKIKRM